MAKKDSYYFPHDYNAKDDPKCMLLIDQLGLEGYGIYWVLIETLRNQPDYRCPISMLPALARRYNTSAEKMLTAVKSFSLFVVKNDSIFFSQSLLDRMSKVDATRKRLSDSGIKGNKIRWQSPSDHNAIALEEKKLKEIKRKESISNTGRPVFFNAEVEILSNKIELERICMSVQNKNYEEPLRKFHLYLEANDKYPQTRKQIFAGFEKWLMNEKKYDNGNKNITASGKHKGAMQLVASLKQDFAARGKENT